MVGVGKCSYLLAFAELFLGGNITPAMVHRALPILAMQSAVRPARAGLMMEIQLAVPPGIGQ